MPEYRPPRSRFLFYVGLSRFLLVLTAITFQSSFWKFPWSPSSLPFVSNGTSIMRIYRLSVRLHICHPWLLISHLWMYPWNTLLISFFKLLNLPSQKWFPLTSPGFISGTLNLRAALSLGRDVATGLYSFLMFCLSP